MGSSWRTSTTCVFGSMLLFGAAQLAAAEPAAAPAKKADAPVCDRAAFRMVVDVGHTEEVPGAKSARGNYEYDFNLALAKRVEQQLREAGFDKTTLLVTHGRAHPSLAERVAHANAASADLFLSIHHDSVPDKFLQKWEYEGEEHSYSDRFKGHSLFISKNNADPKASLQFGSLLGKQLKARDLKYTPHYTEKFMGSRQRVLVDKDAGVYRYDQLIVLKDTRMPAVLLEAGSIINRDEEVAAASPERQALISAAVVDAVDAFCAMRRPMRQPQEARRPTVSASAHSAAPAAAKPAPQPASAFSLPSLFSGKRSQ
jgi:N-acetylmuramoyl-L-alanine amidase